MPVRKNLALLVAASPMTTRPIYINGELYGVYDSAHTPLPPISTHKPSKIAKQGSKKSSKEIKKYLKKIKLRPCPKKPQDSAPTPELVKYKRHKVIPEESLRKVALYGGIKYLTPCAITETRVTMVVKIQQIMEELQLISEFTGRNVMTTRELGLAMRCIDEKWFGMPCRESGILDTLRGVKLENDV